MNITIYTEAGATTGSPRLSWRGTGGISGAACAQKSSSKGKEAPRPNSAGREHSDQAYEAAGSKGPHGPRPVAEPSTGTRPSKSALDGVASGAVGWRQVQKRKQRKDHLDRRCLIVWGLPGKADAGRFSVRLGGKVTCWWRGRGSKKHMVVEFATNMALQAREEQVRTACAQMGVKVAKKTRNWRTREAHRRLSCEGLPANRFTLIDGVRTRVARRPGKKITLERAAAAEKRRRQQNDRYLMPPPAPRPRPNNLVPPMERPGDAEVSKGHAKRAAKAALEKELVRVDTIRVGSLNIRGGMVNDIGEYEEYALKKGYDVLAIQECRLDPSTKLTAKGYKVMRQEAEIEDADHGVLFLVANHLAVGVTREKSKLPNQLWIRLTGMGTKKDMFLCSAYMPQENATVKVRTSTFQTLLDSAKAYAAVGEVVVTGDLNAKVMGAVNAQELRLLGEHCEPGKRKGNGSLLMRVMMEANLVSLAGQVRPPSSVPLAAEAGYWWTRKDPKSKRLHTIDYILVSRSLTGEGTDFWVDYTDLNSDHQLIGAEIGCPRKVVRRRGRKTPRRRFKMGAMIQKSSSVADVRLAEEARASYQACLGDSFAGFKPGAQQADKCDCAGDCVCVGVGDFVRRTMRAAERSAGSVEVGRKFSRSWFDDEVKQAIADRRAAHAVFMQSGSEVAWTEYDRRRRLCVRMTKRKKREDWQKFEEQMEDAFQSNDHRKLWELVNRLAPSGKKATVEPILRKDGTLAKTEEQILDAWGDHQEKLGTPKAHDLEDSKFGDRVLAHIREAEKRSKAMPDADVDRRFTISEVIAAVKKLAYHKAGTADGTVNTMFKCGGEEMAKHLLRLFNWLRERESIPAEWQRSVVVNLFKEGDRADPGNYRGIALISCLGKLYLSMWATRIAKHAEHRLGERQGGFRSGRSTVDQALILHEVLLRRKRAGKDSFLCFVDFRKAFDTVWHAGLWKRMWDSGIRGKAWRVVRNLYSSINACVSLGDCTSRNVSMRQGVRQGCPLSPILFNLFVEKLAERLRLSGFGAKVKGIDLESLLYADDVVLIGDSPTDLQGMIDVVDKFCRQWRMEINLKKSEVMTVREPSRCVCALRDRPERKGEVRTRNGDRKAGDCVLCSPWVCRGQHLKVVRKYKYLGIWFTSDLKWDEHINVKLEMARGRTQRLAKVFSNRRLSSRAKTLVWLSSVRPLLEYGCEVWRASEVQITAMERVQLDAGRIIFRLNSKTSNIAVRGLMEVPELRTRHDMSRLKYMAKLMAMDRGRLARTVVLLAPDPTEPGLGRVKHWWTVTNEFVAKDKVLKDALQRLKQSSERNQKVVPSGIDPTLTDFDYFPIESWRRKVKQWGLSSPLSSFQKSRKPTVKLMLRAIEKDARRMPRFPLTRRPSWGPDSIRLRLLVGTSALNATLSKYADRKPTCPFDSCDGGAEDPIHFLLHCKALDDLRTKFRDRLSDRCTCDRRLGSGGVLGCAEFFEGLDNAGQALFMLGGPVDGRIPEVDIDACAREYVREAWRVRSSTLNKLAEDPLVEDITGARKYGQRGIASFFTPSDVGSRARPTPNGDKVETVTHWPKHAHGTPHDTQRIAQSTAGETYGTQRRASGSGLNDSIYVMRSD